MKKMFAAALAAMMMLTAGTALAASTIDDIKFDGDIKLHYRWNGGDFGDSEGGKVWLRLNMTAPLSKNVDAYGRLALQSLTGDHTGADFSQSYYGDKTALDFDRFGLKIKGGDFTYNVGRQGLSLGATALMYSSEGYMGVNEWAIDGVVATGKAGATNLKVVAGKGWFEGSDSYNVYAVDASYSPAKNWTVGGTLAKVSYDDALGGESTNHWGVNAGYTLGKAGFVAEYTKSNVDVENTAYVVGANYAFDKKHSAYAYYSKVEAFGDMAGSTDFDNIPLLGGKGIYVGYDYKWTKDTTFSVFYKDMKTVSAPADYDSFRLTMTYKF